MFNSDIPEHFTDEFLSSNSDSSQRVVMRGYQPDQLYKLDNMLNSPQLTNEKSESMSDLYEPTIDN